MKIHKIIELELHEIEKIKKSAKNKLDTREE